MASSQKSIDGSQDLGVKIEASGGTTTPFMKELYDLIVAAEPAPDNVYFRDLAANKEVIGEVPIEARKIFTVIRDIAATGRMLLRRQDRLGKESEEGAEGLLLFWARSSSIEDLHKLLGALDVLFWGSINHALSGKLNGRTGVGLCKGWQVFANTREFDEWRARQVEALFEKPKVSPE